MVPLRESTTDLLEAVRCCRALGECRHVLVAVSGGPDSMALLDGLSTVARAMRVTAAHFDHRLRPDSHRDRELVERFCAERGIDCRAGEAASNPRGRSRGRSLEAVARELRYAFLERTADTVGAERIATAHTRDDNIETVLMRMLRGSGVRGLAGIPRERDRIVRPILDVSRSEVLRHCRQRGVPCLEDPSNRDTVFERNYIRHEVLPALRVEIPDADRRLLAVARESTGVLAAVRDTTDPILDRHLVQEGPGVWRLAVKPIEHLGSTQRHVLFADALYHHMGVEKELGRGHYLAIHSVASGEVPSWSLPGATVRREHDFLVFYHGVGVPGRSKGGERVARALPVPGEARLFGRVVRARVLPRDRGRWDARGGKNLESGGELAGAVAYFARERLAPPFTIRLPAPGDRMRPFGMGGHRKKLSDIFIDRKIPYRVRGTIPVVEDRRRIIWVAGVVTSEATRIGDGTDEVVELRIEAE